MSKFFLITKINLMSFFNIKRVTGFKYKSERKKNIGKLLLLLVAFGYLSLYVYWLVDNIMPTFVMLGMPLYLLAMLFMIASVFVLLTNTFKIKSILFDFKDFDLLFSLPIKRSVIIFSKLFSLYLLNLLYILIFMIPGFIAYTKYVYVNFTFLYFLLILFIPVVPIILSCLIGIVMSFFSSMFKNKNVGNYVVTLVFIFAIMFLSFKINGMDSNLLATSSINMINRFEGIYPITNLFIRLLDNFNILDLLLYLIIPFVLIIIFVYIINKFYLQIRNKLLKTNIKNNYQIKKYHANSPLISLYKKELKKLFSNYIYSINSLFGCLVLFIMMVALLFFNENVIGRFIALPDFANNIKSSICFILSLFVALSCTTNSSISLEGKSLWTIKMLPVGGGTIVFSKILVNLTFLLPTILVAGTFFSVYLHLSFMERIILYLMPLVYAIFTSVLGIILNLWFPRFDFDNEIKVIKQSMPVFLSIIISMIVAIIPLVLSNGEVSFYLLVISIIVLIDVILIIYLHYYADRRIRKL